jgi:hypothetical protein
MWYHGYGEIAEGDSMATYSHSSLRLGHLTSQSNKWVVNGTRTTSRFTTFPFAVEPPAEGVAVTRVFCGVCQKDVTVEVSCNSLTRLVRKGPLMSGIAALVLGVIAIVTDSSPGLVVVGLVAVIGGLGAIFSARKPGFGVQVALSEPVESRLLHSILRMKA